MTNKEKAELTVKALSKRKETKEKGLNEAALFRKQGLMKNIARKNKRYY